MDKEYREVNLLELLEAVRARWLTVLGLCLAGGILAFGASYLVQPIYRGYATIVYIDSSESGSQLSGALSQLGGIAGLAGLSLQEDSRRAESLAVLESRELLLEFIREQGITEELFKEIFDPEASAWTADEPPTDWEKLERFKDEALRISDDPKTGLVTVSILWSDPELAARWANALVGSADNKIRKKDLEEFERSIALLTHELEKTAIVGIEQGIYRLIEAQVNKVMLANIREEYAFRVLDPAMVADLDEYEKPARALWFIFGGLLGLSMGFVVTLRKSRTRR